MSKMNVFNRVATRKPGYSRLDLSHSRKLSYTIGRLVPFKVMETVPGDRWEISTQVMSRFASLLAPVMHTVYLCIEWFFVPNRIVWPEWEDFYSGEDIDRPYITFSNAIGGSNSLACIANHMELPIVEVANASEINALPFAGYHKIYNEWYRDQNLVTELEDELIAGDNTSTWATLAIDLPQKRAYEHDYFTSCLPWPQKGDTVLLPLGSFTDVPIYLDIQGTPNVGMQVRDNLGALATGDIQSDGSGTLANGSGNARFLDPNNNLYADTSTLTGLSSDINAVRLAFALQRYMETQARGGSRYTELISARFDVSSRDSRLQRPEYLGRHKMTVTFSEVLSSAETLNSSDVSVNQVGEMYGHGIAVGGSRPIRFFTPEFGFIHGIISVMPKPSYQQGIHKMWKREDNTDYYAPEFANLGEQEVYNYELYADQAPQLQVGTFGYLPRWQEYRHFNDGVSGTFQTSLDRWHLGRKFSSAPVLNQTFIEVDDTDVTRIFAVPTADDHILTHVYLDIKATRPMPKYGIPTIE